MNKQKGIKMANTTGGGAYVPTVWKNGQAPALNAENLNKIEQGIVDVESKIDDVTTPDTVKNYTMINCASGSILQVERYGKWRLANIFCSFKAPQTTGTTIVCNLDLDDYPSTRARSKYSPVFVIDSTARVCSAIVNPTTKNIEFQYHGIETTTAHTWATTLMWKVD